MKKSAIFEDILSIMSRDSSTIKDRAGADPIAFREKISDDMTEDAFLYQVQSYLASFGVIGHISFRRKNAKEKGFVLRSTGQALYVEKADSGTNLQVGDQIIRLAGQPLEAVYESNRSYFTSQTPERHYREWAELVARAGQVTVLRKGREQAVSVGLGQASPANCFEWKLLEEQVVYLRLDNFGDEQAISQLYAEARDAISASKNLIIDVRRNAGGTDSLYFPLLNLALPEGEGYDSLNWEDDGMEILYTERNVDLRLEDFETYLQQEGVSPETKKMLEDMKQELLANRGKGYVKYEDQDQDFFPNVQGSSYPEKIFVLADIYCGSSGDNFVQMMKQFPKVTVVGRPTLGILDYSNCCRVDYGDYSFMFPTSRALALDKGEGMTDKGVEPDILIPWTEEFYTRDVDLDWCLEQIHAG